jgi:hypothetical protein
MGAVTRQQIRIRLGMDPEDGALLFHDGELAAVLIYLSPAIYSEDRQIGGNWSVEVGFGPCAVGSRTLLFDNLDQASAWVLERTSERRLESRDVTE